MKAGTKISLWCVVVLFLCLGSHLFGAWMVQHEPFKEQSPSLDRYLNAAVLAATAIEKPPAPHVPDGYDATVRACRYWDAAAIRLTAIKNQLILDVGYGIENRGALPRVFTLYCEVVNESPTSKFRPAAGQYTTIIEGHSNESGGVVLRWPEYYRIDEAHEFMYICSCISVEIGNVGFIKGPYSTVRP